MNKKDLAVHPGSMTTYTREEMKGVVGDEPNKRYQVLTPMDQRGGNHLPSGWPMCHKPEEGGREGVTPFFGLFDIIHKGFWAVSSETPPSREGTEFSIHEWEHS
jgi:hypothetical protein